MAGNTKSKFDLIAYWLLCAIVFDCAAFGGGSIIKIGGIDFRMVLFAAFFLASLPAVIRGFKRVITNAYFVLLFFWGLWMIFSTVRGYLAGNRLDLIVSAWVGFASFGILPGVIAVLRDREQIIRMMKAVCIASFVLMLQNAVVFMIYNIDLDAFIHLNSLMIRYELGGCTGVNYSIVRIFFRSHPFMVFGCGCSFYFMVTEKSRRVRALHGINVTLCLISLLMSYTRSIYLCVAVTGVLVILLLALILGKETRRMVLRSLLKIAGLFVAVILLMDLIFGTFFMAYALSRTTGHDILWKMETAFGIDSHVDIPEAPEDLDDGEYDPENPGSHEINHWSDAIRNQTEHELSEGIRENPLIGSGLGAVLAIRPDGYNEYFFMDLFYKTGIIGLMLYLAPMLLMLAVLILSRKKTDLRDRAISSVWLAGILGFAAFSFFNPYLNGSNGITLYCCAIGVFSAINQKQTASE